MLPDDVGPPMLAARPWAPKSVVHGHRCQLPLIMSWSLVERSLGAHGHLAEVSKLCGVGIDVSKLPADNTCVVTLTGAPVANALAVMQLQWRSALYSC